MGRLTVLGCASVLVLAPLSLPSSAAGVHRAPTSRHRPNLSISKVTAPVVVTAGHHLTVRSTVVDAGRRAPATRTAIYLSTDRQHSRHDTGLGRVRTPALAAGHRKRMAFHAVLPSTTAAGGYFLIACVDATGHVHETSEHDNCRATGSPVAVVAKPRPLIVHTAKDTGAATSATIGSAGGTLRATGPDGTSYTLTVPARALTEDTTIGLTPLTSVTGSGLSTPRGVRMTPEGVRPLVPARLTVVPATGHAAPVVGRASFAFEGSGREFHLVASRTTADGFSVSVARLGGYGVGVAGLAARRRLARAHPPTAVSDQLAQAVGVGSAAGPFAHARLAAGRAAGGFPHTSVDALLVAEGNTILGLLLGDDVASLDTALVHYVVWRGLAGAAPRVEPLRAAIDAALPGAVQRRVLAARTRCAEDHLDALGTLLLLRSYGWALSYLDVDHRAIETAIDGCLRFSADYHGHVHDLIGDPGDPLVEGDIVVDSADAPVRLGPTGAYGPAYVLTGSLPLAVTSYEFYDYLCNQHGGTATPKQPGTLTVRLIPGLPYDSYVPGRPNPLAFPPPDIEASLAPGSVETLNACARDAFSRGLYDQDLPGDFADVYAATRGELVLPRTLFTARGGEAVTLYDGSRTATDSNADIRLTLAHRAAP